MQFAFQHTAKLETHTFQTREVELTITYQYTPPSRGSRGPYGEPEEPDEQAEVEILSIVDATGKEYQPWLEGISFHSLCWDHLETVEQ